MTTTTLLLGLGRFGGGVGAARYLLRQRVPLRVADDAAPESLIESRHAVEAVAEELGGTTAVDWHLGCASTEPTTIRALLDGVDRIVANPAIPSRHPLLVAASSAGIEATQEVALFLEAFPGRVIAVTGTNGKSSTATLLARLLRADSSRPVLLGGNLGGSLLDYAPSARGGPCRQEWSSECCAVVELSSFQLERLSPTRHRIAGAILTSLGSDHLDRHGTLEEYWRLKARALAMARDFVALPEALLDPLAAIGGEPIRAAATRLLALHHTPGRNTLGRRNGYLWSGLAESPGPILHAAAMHTPGGVWLDNAALAAAAALHSGIDRHSVGLGIATDRPLQHRLQRVTTLADGIEVWDDAVATSFDATLAAIRAFDRPVHWVGGGRSKQPGRAIEPAATELPASGVRSAHLFGESAATLAAILDGRVTTTTHTNLENALDAARDAAQAGEILLFSPAFASFDQFVNYRQRAAAFHAWVTRAQQRPDR